MDIQESISIIQGCVNTLMPSSGVYKMISKNGQILYIGKAKDLKKRITQYTNINNLSSRVKTMICLINKIDIIYTKSENEASLLEVNLIRTIKPRYNIMLKDDRKFSYITLDKGHNFPKIQKSYSIRDSNLVHFGPFLSIKKLDNTIMEIQKLFQIRSCSDQIFSRVKSPCIMYDIKRCSAPCVNKISYKDYQSNIEELERFFSGKTKHIHTRLLDKMNKLSKSFMYEKAIVVRDQIRLLNYIQSRSIFNHLSNKNIDIFIYHDVIELKKYCIQVCIIKNGMHFDDKCYYFDKDISDIKSQKLYEFVISFYRHKNYPTEIWLSHKDINLDIITQSNIEIARKKIKIISLTDKDKNKVYLFFVSKFKIICQDYIKSYFIKVNIFKDLKNKFNLLSIPKRIEVYDNSHNNGCNPVGCVIVVNKDGFMKDEYRKYVINEHTNTISDYYILREVITRRFKKRDKYLLPDLVIIDGGKGHLSTAINVFNQLNIKNVNIVAMSKGPNRKSGRECFYQYNKKSLLFDKNDKTLLFLQNIRDEVHKFAISTYRMLAIQNSKKSFLDSIKGIGNKRKKNILLHFDAIKDIKYASEDDLIKINGINKILAKAILYYIRHLNI